MAKSYYKPNPMAISRRQHLAELVRAGLSAMHHGITPSAEQAAAIRNAARTANRALREGQRADYRAKQQGVLIQIEQARAAYAAWGAQQDAKAAEYVARQQAAAAPVDPFGPPATAEVFL